MLLVPAGLQAAAPVIIGVSDGNYDALRLEQGRFEGSLAQLYGCVFDRVDFEFELETYPQPRVLHLLQQGEISIGMPLVKTADRDRFAEFAHPILQIEFYVYSFRKIDVDDDISQYRFVFRRTAASKELVTARGGAWKEVESWPQAIELARLQRFDGVVIPRLIARSFPASDYGSMHRSPFGMVPLGIYVSRQIDDSGQLLGQLNRAIEDCQS